MVKLGLLRFKECLDSRGSSLMFFKGNKEEKASWSVDIDCKEKRIFGEEIAPSICINPIETDKQSYEELVGEKFYLEDEQLIEEREDGFYLFELEPMIKYSVEIKEIKNQMALVYCRGEAITDSTVEPPKTKKFKAKSWIPIICDVSDWEKFGL